MGTTHPTRDVTIDPRYCGPPGVGNGGIVCAILAERCGLSLEVTLRRPAPLGRALSLCASGDGVGWALVDGDRIVAEARPSEVDVAVPSPPDEGAAREATRVAALAPHPFPECFVCGPARPVGDGLRTLAGPVPGRPGLVAATWRPHAAFGDGTGHVDPRYLWAALDCPGGMAALGGRSRPIVLGRFAGRLEGAVPVGEPCVVLGWRLAGTGRRHEVGTAIVDASGRVCGRARATWVELAQAPAAAA
jgi:hypothetical protein